MPTEHGFRKTSRKTITSVQKACKILEKCFKLTFQIWMVSALANFTFTATFSSVLICIIKSKRKEENLLTLQCLKVLH